MKIKVWRTVGAGLSATASALVAYPVSAQTSVQLYGTVDGGVRYQTNAAKGGGTIVTMNSNGYYSSNKLGFLGREDLSDGWNAHFRLENGFNVGNGQFDNTTGVEFNRQAYVGIGNNKYGIVDLGRQYTISHDIISIYDPFAFHFTPILPLTTASDGTRNNNAVKYRNTFGPLLFEVDNSLGGVAGNFAGGATRSVGMSYALGPASVGGVYGHRNILTGTSYVGDSYYMAGAAYKFGPVQLSGGFMSEDLQSPTASHQVTNNGFGGISWSITPTLVFDGGYYQTTVSTDKASRRGLSILSLAYSLSKRTTLYSEVDYTSYKHAVVSTLNPAGASSQTAVTVGIDVLF
ncbi:outer membrane protein (porin) [Caballeronia sordidicola]|uniref:Outer membrane protein (Porin) n=1 Tax=Caballeronia sordidicola TaxID=196367 RepID=A0A158IFG3_CABSO|nr:porin [Caballeronia sordidicola]SAL55286.1 outer membrane protein (porin) [Caballeronia sordidicola]